MCGNQILYLSLLVRCSYIQKEMEKLFDIVMMKGNCIRIKVVVIFLGHLVLVLKDYFCYSIIFLTLDKY